MDSIIVLAAVLVAAGVIALAAWLIYRALHPKLKQEEKTDKDYAQEELNRILQPVEDEETAKQISEYKEKDD
ncbi:MAG: hypothetical protein HUJ59_04590 [Bacilli bacterium]|nr:hypothetical protein [Bacilli bacterium]